MATTLAFLGRSLAKTIVIELGASLALGVRRPTDLAVIALAQALTNPVVAWGAARVGWTPGAGAGPWTAVMCLELAAVAVEALVYRSRLSAECRWREHPWCLSVLLNALSFAAGLVLAWAS